VKLGVGRANPQRLAIRRYGFVQLLLASQALGPLDDSPETIAFRHARQYNPRSLGWEPLRSRTVSRSFIACLLAGTFSAASADAVTCRVEMRGGLPTFIIDGRPHSGVCYSSYDCSPENLSRRVRQFAEAGCEIFNFVVEISGYGYSRPMWAERDRWDFQDLDRRARTILAAAPRAWLLPRIYIDAPAWWLRENPGEKMVLSTGATSFPAKHFALPRAGEYASLASEKWRADMKRALETVIEHVERSDYRDRVIGYQLSGQKTEEWYHWSMNTELLADYSPAMLQAFRRWLRERYESEGSRHTPCAVRCGTQCVPATFLAADIPSQAERYGDRSKTFRDPVAERPVVDFHRFWSDVMADTIAFFAGAVKKKTNRTKIVGAFYGYTFEFAELGEDAGHLALGRLLRSPDVDFIMAPSSYFNRNLPGTPYFRAPVASVNLRGKVVWNDFDQVSYKYFEKLRANPGLKQWEWQMGLTKTAEEFVWMNRREVGMELAQGVQLAHFDIHGGYYEDPEIMEGVKRLIALRNQALAWPDRSSRAEIVVLMDEDSEHYFSFRNPLLTDLLSGQLAPLGFVAPYDTLLLSDLGLADTRRYKLAVVLNAAKIDPEDCQTLHRKLACNGKTVLWLHAPGYLTSQGKRPENMEAVTGIRIVPDPDSPNRGTAKLSDRNLGGPMDVPILAGEQFCVADPDATPLAVRADRPNRVVAACKQLPGWVSIYSAAAPLPAVALRSIADTAGVHLYTNRPDCLIFASRRCIMLGAPQSGGQCEVTLPEKGTVVDHATGTTLSSGASRFTIPMRPKEVRILLLQ
jgi:hypothetical protein